MTVTITGKTYTYTNGNDNDGSQVNTEFVNAFNNDSALKTKVDTLLSGNIEDGETLTINSAYTGSSPPSMSFAVERGTLSNRAIRWNESAGYFDLTNDGSTYSQIQTTATIVSIPAGIITPYAGSSAPTGYLLCFGQAVSRTTHATLFAVISTTYGTGNGSTTFNLPDLRGRIPLGLDNMGGSTASRITSASTNGANSTTLGGAGGSETHTLDISQMPAHTHPIGNTSDRGAGGGGGILQNNGNINSGSTGGGGAHSNTQPWLALNYLIKT